MREWQFNVLFVVGVAGAAFLLVMPYTGLDVEPPPTAAAGVGAILAFVLTQKPDWTNRDRRDDDESEPDG